MHYNSPLEALKYHVTGVVERAEKEPIVNKQPVTRVVFRKWNRKNGTVIALFPDIGHAPGLVSSYEHVGQHGGADYSGVINHTKPATPDEYADLKKELESAPYNYNLRVVKRA
jgi:hypothetical protein